MFTQDYLLKSLFVRGEVSNCKYHSSGHIYFTLKDLKGTVSCVMFAGNRNGLGFRLMDGQQVVVGGSVDVYERDGKYQLYARQITLYGAGQLYEKLEALKRELSELGMFSMEYKQPIPKFVKTLGVVTADTGAAVRDIIQIATRRNPYVQIILYPAIVQGDAAVNSIIDGIRTLERKKVDVMIVGRGGGSIEDLWAFNEREVAQAVFDCSIPIISAVGHETDTTIIDYVSDLRAPTPSAAAELAVCDIRDVFAKLDFYKGALLNAMESILGINRERYSYFATNLRHLSPMGQIREKKLYSAQLEDKLNDRMQWILSEKRQKLAICIEKMKGLSPLERLNGGFAYVTGSDGVNIRSVRQAGEGELINICLRDGYIEACVSKIVEENIYG